MMTLDDDREDDNEDKDDDEYDNDTDSSWFKKNNIEHNEHGYVTHCQINSTELILFPKYIVWIMQQDREFLLMA